MKIIIRTAQLKDLPRVRILAEEAVVSGIPHTREITPQEVRQSLKEALADLEYSLKLEKNFELLVAEDTDAGVLAGYLMLVLNQIEPSTGEKQALIHDIAVTRAYRGKPVLPKLFREAVKISRAAGLKYLVGEISISNKRTLQAAIRGFGFIPERIQLVKKLT